MPQTLVGGVRPSAVFYVNFGRGRPRVCGLFFLPSPYLQAVARVRRGLYGGEIER